MDKMIKQRIILFFLLFLIQAFIPDIEQLAKQIWPMCLETIVQFSSILDRATAIFGAMLTGNTLLVYKSK